MSEYKYMPLTVELCSPEEVILDELQTTAAPQRSVAITYAYGIAKFGAAVHHPTINDLIGKRWPVSTNGFAALDRIKTFAWKQLQEWHASGMERTQS